MYGQYKILLFQLLMSKETENLFVREYFKFLEQIILKYVIILIKEKIQDFTRGF